MAARIGRYSTGEEDKRTSSRKVERKRSTEYGKSMLEKVPPTAE